MAYPGWKTRDLIAPHFRFRLLDAIHIVPFRHQAVLFAYLDRKEIASVSTCDVDDIPQPGERPLLRTWIEGVEHWLLCIPQFYEVELDKYGETVRELVPKMLGDEPVVDYRYFAVVPSGRIRPQTIVLSGAFKCGKSEVGGVVPGSFAICPGLKWDFWGMEYEICAPEFEYLLDALLSERGLNLPYVPDFTGDELLGYTRWKCEPKLGRMHLTLSNGTQFICRSLKQAMETKSDPLKGKEMDGFSICEVYQIPSIQSVLGYRQNLAARRGYYVMPSTPDRPVMDEINDRADPGNEEYEAWIGVKEVPRRENPFAFVLSDYIEDLQTFSQEEITVYWDGKSGKWIGAVYPPAQYFDTVTHPQFWVGWDGKRREWANGEPPAPTLENFRAPTWMKRLSGADTATLYSVVDAICNEEGDIFFLNAECNYRYVSGHMIEQRKEVTVESLSSEVRGMRSYFGGKWPAAWVDHNCQWVDEFRRHGCPIRKSPRRDMEQRCEVTRGMAQNGFLWFAPWLKGSELVWEFEIAKYPPKEKVTGKRRRLDQNDHNLDSAEHLCAMHPRATQPADFDLADPVRALLSAKKRPLNLFGGDPQVGG